MKMNAFHTALLCAVLVCANERIIAAPLTPDQQLERSWASIEKATDNLGPRQLMDFALEAATLRWPAERIDAALEKLEPLQDRDPSSKTYGNFRWYQWQPTPVDLNAVEFTMQKGILLWNLHKDELSPKSRERLAKMIDLSVEGIKRHPVVVGYTNIFLMKTWNLIAIGEGFQRKDVAALGYAMLKEWINDVQDHGVQEYMSPTYTAVQLECLALIQKFAGRPQDREAAQKALQLYYWQCRANFFTPDLRLGGSHSRDYDFLRGRGAVDAHFADWGWITDFKPPVLNGFTDLASWTPTDTTSFPETSAVPRFVWQRWGKQPEEYATNYIGQSINIGVSGVTHGVEDKLFNINFGGGPKMVMANFFMDGRGDSYLQNKVKLRDGHTKAHHLAPFFVSAQDGPNVVFISSQRPPDPAKQREDFHCLYSHLDLPFEATVWQNDKEVDHSATGHAALEPGKPVFLRFQNTAVGLRFEASDDKGKPIPGTYYRDGDEYSASRISWAHATTTPKGEAHVILWARVAENLDDDGFAKFRAQFTAVETSFHAAGGRIVARVKNDSGAPLSIEADTNTGGRRTSVPASSGFLKVNGKEIGRAILTGTNL